MNRFTLYIAGLVISTIITLFFFYYSFIDSIYFLVFLLATVSLIFETASLPVPQSMTIPEVHYFHKSRINNFGYLMGGLAVGASILFSALSLLQIRLAVIVFLDWSLIAAGSFFLVKNNNKRLLTQIITDYIELLHPDLIGNADLVALVNKVIELNNKYSSADKIKTALNKSHSSNLHDSDKIIDEILNYLVESQRPLSGDEVKEINKTV